MRSLHWLAWRPAAAFFAFAVPLTAAGQVPPSTSADSLRALSESVVLPGVNDAAVPRAVLGISLHGMRHYYGYSGTGETPLSPDSIVEIGSITKVFTTALLAEAIGSGAIAPDRSIQAYLPDVPLRPCTARITSMELADFTSGLPELPDDAPRNFKRRGMDNYTTQNFLNWLSAAIPNSGCSLPASYLYSNASVGLLGPILANATRRPWHELLASEITGPLGMPDTAVDPARAHRAEGHYQNGHPAPPWPVFAWYAAGALRSTAQDMLAFGEAALGHPSVNGRPVPPALTAALRLAMRPVYQPNDKPFAVGLSWVSEPDGTRGTMTYKDGGTDGFNSVIVVDLSKDCAIFLVGNKAKAGIPRLGMSLMRAIRR